MTDAGMRRRDVLRLAASAALLGGCGPRRLRSRNEREPLRVVFYTDVHARPDPCGARALARAAAAINAEHAGLVIGGGDYVSDGLTSSAAVMAPRWDAFMRMHDVLAGERHAVLGNHDLVAALPADGSPPARDPRAEFRARFGRSATYYAFDHEGRHVVILDAIDVVGGTLGYRGWIGPAQLAWLEGNLARVPLTTPIVLVTHMPLVTAFYGATEGATVGGPANRVVVNGPEVLRRFARHRLQLVLQGHLHVHEEIRWRGTTFVTGGAVAGAWWRGPWHGTPPGFTVVTLHEDRVETVYRTLDGAVGAADGQNVTVPSTKP